MTDPSSSLGFLLSDAARLLRLRFDQKARHLGLTRAQWRALAQLARDEGASQARLAELLDLEPITVCRLVDRMEEGGWLERRPDPADRRKHLLFLTPRARPMIAEMRALAEEVYAEALAGLPPEARAQLLALLEQVRANLAEARVGSAGAAA